LIESHLDRLHWKAMQVFAIGDYLLSSEMLEAEKFWREHLPEMKDGAVMADIGPFLFAPMSLPVSHGWNPETNQGWLGAMSAADLADEYEAQAISQYRQGHFKTMAFLLGAVCHLRDDVGGIPQHVLCKLPILDGHAAHEEAVEKLNGRVSFGPFDLTVLPGVSEANMPKQPTSVWVKFLGLLCRQDFPLVGSNSPESRSRDEEVGRRSLERVTAAGASHFFWLYRRIHQ
jgi:hypothetical protein